MFEGGNNVQIDNVSYVGREVHKILVYTWITLNSSIPG